MILLDIDKPERGIGHYKALVYSDLFKRGFDVYMDVWSNALYQYTSGVKGYQKTKFDMVIYLDGKAKLIVNFTQKSRRLTKINMYKIPIVHVDIEKWEKSNPIKDIINKLTERT